MSWGLPGLKEKGRAEAGVAVQDKEGRGRLLGLREGGRRAPGPRQGPQRSRSYLTHPNGGTKTKLGYLGVSEWGLEPNVVFCMHASFPHAAPVFLTAICSCQNCICCLKTGSVELKTWEGTWSWLSSHIGGKMAIPFGQS